MSCVTHFALVCTCIQLFRERLSTKMCTRQSRKVIWNVGQYTVPGVLSCRTYFCCFPLILANRRPRPLVPFLHISSKNSELKTTHNPFRDCSVHFFQQPFSKQLYGPATATNASICHQFINLICQRHSASDCTVMTIQGLSERLGRCFLSMRHGTGFLRGISAQPITSK